MELGRWRRTIGSCGRRGAGGDGVVGGAGRAQRGVQLRGHGKQAALKDQR